MKKILALIVLCFIFLTSCSKEKEEEVNTLDKIINRDLLIVGVKEDAGVFGHINDLGKHDGFDIDVAKYVAKKILGDERKLKLVSVTSNTRIEAITSSKVDMVIATMSNTKARRYFIDFSFPYYFAGQTVVVKDDSDIYTFSDLKNKTVIVVLGSTSEQNLRRIMPMVRVTGYSNYKEAFEALKNGKGDALSTDDTIISGFISKNPEYRALKNKISSEPYAIGIKQTDDRILKERLDSIVKEMRKDGTINKLKKKWDLL